MQRKWIVRVRIRSRKFWKQNVRVLRVSFFFSFLLLAASVTLFFSPSAAYSRSNIPCKSTGNEDWSRQKVSLSRRWLWTSAESNLYELRLWFCTDCLRDDAVGAHLYPSILHPFFTKYPLLNNRTLYRRYAWHGRVSFLRISAEIYVEIRARAGAGFPYNVQFRLAY